MNLNGLAVVLGMLAASSFQPALSATKEVTVLVVFTEDAATSIGSVVLRDQFFENVNSTFDSLNVPGEDDYINFVRARPAGASEVRVDLEEGDSTTMADAAAGLDPNNTVKIVGGDTTLQDLRWAWAADVVVVIGKNSAMGGAGSVPTDGIGGGKELAYVVVGDTEITGPRLTDAHEMGHILDAVHDHSAFDNQYEHLSVGTAMVTRQFDWCTNDFGNCLEIPFFSKPGLTFVDGIGLTHGPLGDNNHNNWQRIREFVETQNPEFFFEDLPAPIPPPTTGSTGTFNEFLACQFGFQLYSIGWTNPLAVLGTFEVEELGPNGWAPVPFDALGNTAAKCGPMLIPNNRLKKWRGRVVAENPDIDPSPWSVITIYSNYCGGNGGGGGGPFSTPPPEPPEL